MLKYVCVVSEPFAENTYLVYDDASSGCIVVDPGFDAAATYEALRELGREPSAILITHGHADHIVGIDPLLDEWPQLPLVIGAEEAPKLTDAELNLSAGFGFPIVTRPANVLVREGDWVEYAGLKFEVRLTPGHSSGHVVYVWHDGTPAVVIGGDVLFAGSVGRTDLPGGSFEQLRSAIHGQLFTLSDTTIVLPGHGPPTTTGEEKRSNPYVGLHARGL